MKQVSLVFLVFILLNCSIKKSTPNDLMVGVAANSINPEVGAFIAGDKQNRRFKGIHDSLFVKVVVVSTKNESMAIVTVDCIGLLYPTLLQIREATAKLIPANEFNPSHIVVSSTHTHAGPDVVGIWGPNQITSGVQKEYMDRLVKTAAEKIAEAWSKKQPAKIKYAETTHGDGWVFNISVPDELDRTVSILQFISLDQKSIATLTNFACHPTFLDAKTDLVSADYVAGYYKKMNEKAKGIHLFLQGAIGGWVQPEGQEKSFENADNKGFGLADAVLLAIEKSKSTENNELIFRSKVLNMPVANPGFIQLSKLGVFNRTITDSVQTEMAYFEIGDGQFITHPGETSPLYSLESKKMMSGSGPKFVMGLSMDALGYIVKPDFFNFEKNLPHSEYLRSMSLGEKAGPTVMEAAKELIIQKPNK